MNDSGKGIRGPSIAVDAFVMQKGLEFLYDTLGQILKAFF